MAQKFNATEQLFLEYVNRARLDPERETLRLLDDPRVTDPDLLARLEDLQSAGLDRGLGTGAISGLPLQVLAPNDLLRDAASAHSNWMLDTNVFSHTGQDGSSDEERINAAGYALTDEAGIAIAPPAAWGENLSWLGNVPGPVDMGLAVITHAAGLFNSDGHRANILSESFRETGVAQIEGVFTSAGTDWNASMLTQKFALSGTDVFLTGVVYSDHDGNGFYSLGEGESGITIATTALSTVSATHGGYALGVSGVPDVDVTLTWGTVSIGATVDLSGGNVKLDLVAGSDDSLRLLSSGDLILGAGATAAQLIGAGDLTLQANDSGNLLLGNYGNNTLTGGAGNDTLAGGAGNDTLDGGGGFNRAVFSGNLADYDISNDQATGITTVSDLRDPDTLLDPQDGVNTLTNIHEIQFADQLFDLAAPSDIGGGTAMSTTFSITGFGFSFDDDTNQVTAITGPATLALSFTQAAPVISYTQIAPPDGEPGILPDIDFGGNEPTSTTINGMPPPGGIDPSIGRITWSDGGQPRVTDVLNLFISDEVQFLFVVGGDPLPDTITPATLNAILNEAVMNNGGTPLPLPPASSDFPPDSSIALTGLDGWTQQAAVEPVAISFTGFSFNPDGFDSDAALDLQETELSFALPSADVLMSYMQVGLTPEDDFDGDGLAVVELGFTEEPLGFSFGGRQQSFDDGDYTLEMGRFVTSEGTHDILLIDDEASGRQHFFQLGGDPLTITNLAEFQAFFGTVQSLNPIPDSSPLGQFQTIVPGSLPGAVTTPLVPYALAGYQVGYIGTGSINEGSLTTATSIAMAEMTILAPAESATFSYDVIGPHPEGSSAVLLSSPGPFFVQVPGLDNPTALQTLIARLTDDDGVTYDFIEFINPTGGNSNLDFFFQIGGPELSFNTLAEFDAFRATISSVGSIPPGDPLGPNTPIPLAGLGFAPDGAPAPAPVMGTGDPAIIQFNGYRVDEDEDDNLLGFQASQLTVALAADDNVYSYSMVFDPFSDGFESVDITGPEPYAFLIDGVVPFNDPDIGFERITVDGISYDLMFVRLDDDGSTYVFQIDGAAPLPFTSLAAVEAFIEKADEDDAFGPIPAGSPFAPDTVFTFLNSPYATADTSPQIIEGGNFGRGPGGAEYGRGANTEGSLTVVNGAELTLEPNGANGPFMSVGRNGGYGVITVAGPGSSMDLVGGGGNDFPDEGVSVNIGRDGGTGGLRVLDDARFSISDPVGTTAGPNFDGNELFWVGRISQNSDATSAYGYVDVISATFEHRGTGTIAAYGRGEGSEGYLYLEDGATYRQETTSDSDFTRLTFGRDGGFGEGLIDHSRLTVQAAENGFGSLEIGFNSGGYDAPNGILRIFGDGSGTHGAMMVGGANSPYVEAALGRNGGGLVEVFGGYFGVLNRGVTYDDDLNQINLPGDGGGAEMTIGRDGGRGMVVANFEAELFVSGTESARMNVGAGNGSLGEVFMSESELRVFSTDGQAGLNIGTWDGGKGLLSMTLESDAEIRGADGAYVNVGRDTDNEGKMLLREGSDLRLHGESNFTALEIGAVGGFGEAEVTSGASIHASGANTFLGIGNGFDDDDGGSYGSLLVSGSGSRVSGFQNTQVGTSEGDGTASGYLRVENGAIVQLGAPDGGNPSLNVGRGGGSFGALEIDHALMSIYAPDGGAEPYTSFGEMGGFASVDIQGDRGIVPDAAHGFIQIGGGGSNFATLDIGRGAGSSGSVNVDGAFFGTQNNGVVYETMPPFDPIDQDGDGGRAVIRIGVQGGVGSLNAGGDSEIFAQGGADGAALIVGESGGYGVFTLASGELLVEGAESTAFIGIGSGGIGEMTMLAGAQGRVELLEGQTGFQQATIAVGYEGGAGGGRGSGTFILQGAGTLLEVVSAARANLDVGGIEDISGDDPGPIGAGDGFVRIQDGATLSYESVENQELSIGRNGGDGVFEVLDGGTFAARTTGAGFASFMLVGTEGGSGSVLVDNASLSIVSESDNAGIRLGTRYTNTEDNTGTGSLVLQNSAEMLIEGGGTTNFWVGGLEDGNGSAIIRSGAVLTMTGADNFAIIGGVFGATDAAGGMGSLEVTGAGSRLAGANTLLVGFNSGTGTMDISEGANVAIDGNGSGALLGIGVHSSQTGNGGVGTASVDGANSLLSVQGTDAVGVIGGNASTGSLSIANGASVELESGIGGPEGAQGALLDIGRDGGSGSVSLEGAESTLSVTGASGTDGMIRVAAEGDGSTGLLHVKSGAHVITGAVQVGASAATSGVLALADGLVTGAVSVFENGWFGGTGTVTGDVTVSAGTFRVGDLYDAQTGPSEGLGTLDVTGDLALGSDATAAFEVSDGAGDFLSVGGALDITGTAINISYLDAFDPANGPLEFRLAHATGGINLEDVALTSNLDSIEGIRTEFELREEGTELWFTVGPATVTVTGTVTIRELNPGAVSRAGTVVEFDAGEDGTFTATTDSDGVFSFEVPVGAMGNLSLVRDYNPTSDKTLNVDDVIAMFQLITAPDPASIYAPLDMRAADFDQNGQANVDDVIALFQFVAGGGAAPRYVFVDDDAPQGEVDRDSIPLPEPFTIAPLMADTESSFTAILGGDLFGYNA